MQIGDKFIFNIELMNENNISTGNKNNKEVQTVLNVQNSSLGTLIGYKLLNENCPDYFAQINEYWIIPV